MVLQNSCTRTQSLTHSLYHAAPPPPPHSLAVRRQYALARKDWQSRQAPPSAVKWVKLFPPKPLMEFSSDTEVRTTCSICVSKFDLLKPRQRCSFTDRQVRACVRA